MSFTIEVANALKEHINTEHTEQDSPEQRLLKIKEEEHKQTMRERQQRQIIGWIVGIVVIILPFLLVVLLWGFILNPSDSGKIEMWTLTVMFSSTYIAVVALYGGLIAAVFRKIGGDKTDDTPASILERIESAISKLAKNGDKP